MASWPSLPAILSFIFVASVAASPGFVYRQGHQLMIDGKPWYFIGANAYWLWDEAKWGDKEHINDFFRYCQDYNLKVIRIWGYSHNSPKAKGVYDKFEMEMLDFIISSAGKHNVRLIIALSNFWEAYRSPEELMSLAGEEVEGRDVLDYYRSNKVKQFLKGHFLDVVSRNNTLTGLAYRDDPTIMCWTAMNEARCPGCLAEAEQRDHLAFISELSQAIKDYAPKQLVSTGTEGFFYDESMVKYNPGAGVRCEGEEWLKLGQLPSIDLLNAHIYWRQMEYIPGAPWRKPEFTDFMSWVYMYLNKHIAAAKEANKPYIVEEFNLILPKHTKEEQMQYFHLMYDFLRWQASIGGPFSGALFWNAAIGDYAYNDGYNIYLDVALAPAEPEPAPEATGNTSDIPAPEGSGTSPLGNVTSVEPAPQEVPLPAPEPERKEIFENTETLNDFRRVAQRSSCAENEAKTWLPEWDKDWARERIDLQDYRARTQGKRVQDIIRDMGNTLRQYE